jgi:hypothetical protein
VSIAIIAALTVALVGISVAFVAALFYELHRSYRSRA